MRWDSTKPSNRDQAGDSAKHMRSIQSELDNYLQTVFWWSDSADSAGVPRYSTTTGEPGTGQVLYLSPSEISYRNRGAELMVDSENRRLKVITDTGSDDSVVLGSAQAIASYLTMAGTQGNQPKMIQNTKVVVESSLATCAAATSLLSTRVTYSSAYGAPPIIYLTSGTTDAERAKGSAASYSVYASYIGTSFATLQATSELGTVNDVVWFWRSIGTKSL